MGSVQKGQIPFFKTKTNFFKDYSFPAVIMKWNEFDVNIRNSAFLRVLYQNSLDLNLINCLILTVVKG